MKKNILTLLIAFASVTSLFAAKPTAYMQEFKNSANIDDGWVASIRGAVLEGIQATNRLSLVDAIAEQSRYEEEIRRMQDNLATGDLSLMEELKTRGSSMLVNGNIASLSVSETILDGGTKSYEANITLTVNLVNALDGEIIASKTFNLPKKVPGVGIDFANILNVFKTPGEAVQALCGDVKNATKKFMNENVKIQGPVEQIETLSKNKQEVEDMYVGIGEADGLTIKSKLDIKVAQKIGKKFAMKTIGEAEVKEIAGDDISLVKVKKGGKEVKNALDAGQELFVTTK